MPANLNEEIESQRAAFQNYMRGDQKEPLLIEHSDDYCLCEVVYHRWKERLLLGLRYTIVGLALLTPFSFMKIFLYRLMGAKIGRRVYLSPFTLIDPYFPRLIEIEDDCLLGLGARVMTHEYTIDHFRIGRVHIGRGSVIGAQSTVRSGVTIGEKVMVGTHSYVNKDVASGQVVGGVPARPLKKSNDKSMPLHIGNIKK